MNGAGESRRRTAPPQASQVFSGSSVMRCRTSNTRWQASHWYSYVGTSEGYMGGKNVSTRHGLALALIVVVLLAGCAAKHVSQPDRYRAQAAYDRALAHL